MVVKEGEIEVTRRTEEGEESRMTAIRVRQIG